MNTLKNVLLVIIGILIISSFTANEKKELSNGEKNIELIKKLIKENELIRVTFQYTGSSSNFLATLREATPEEITYDDIYIKITRDEESELYINTEKIITVDLAKKILYIKVQQ
jgi:hypothetical protein